MFFTKLAIRQKEFGYPTKVAHHIVGEGERRKEYLVVVDCRADETLNAKCLKK